MHDIKCLVVRGSWYNGDIWMSCFVLRHVC